MTSEEVREAGESPVKPGRQRRVVTGALMLAMAVVALEGTVVTTALPSVVGELQGLTLYPWVFSIFLLASTTTVPIYGKLADVYGRKPVMLAGLSLFILGTALCGAAQSMVQLVALRGLQGIGAGAVLPMTLTILGDIYDLRERAKVQPLTASVWGILSLTGPALGAFITVTLSWRWVFWVSIPVGVLAGAVLAAFLTERVQRRRVQIDYAGALTLTLGLIALLLAALEGGHALPWLSWQMAALLGVTVLLFVLFGLAERRAADPVLPFEAFRLREVAVSNVGNVLFGVCMFGLSSYVPLFVQGVRGESAAGAGAVLTPLQAAWSAMALVAGRLYVRVGYRATALLGATCAALGIAPLVFVTRETPLPVLMVGMALAGIGFGNASTAFLLAPQNAVPWSMRGAVTSSTQFARTIGGAVGVALLGAALNARMAAEVSGENAEAIESALLTPATRAGLPADVVGRLSTAMGEGLHTIYAALLVVALLGVANVVLFARRSARVVERGDAGTARDASPVGNTLPYGGATDDLKRSAAGLEAGAGSSASSAAGTSAGAASPGVASPSRR